jgi:hypothetical protein
MRLKKHALIRLEAPTDLLLVITELVLRGYMVRYLTVGPRRRSYFISELDVSSYYKVISEALCASRKIL